MFPIYAQISTARVQKWEV